MHWIGLSRVDRPLVGKPVLPMGVSQGALGTVRAQLHLASGIDEHGRQCQDHAACGQ